LPSESEGLAVACDVGSPEDIETLVASANEAFGPISVFCSNAGYSDTGDALALAPRNLRKIVDVNLLSHVWATQSVLPGMLERGEDDESLTPSADIAALGDAVEPEDCARLVLDAAAAGHFLALPHPRGGRVLPAEGDRLRRVAGPYQSATTTDADRRVQPVPLNTVLQWCGSKASRFNLIIHLALLLLAGL
jgi:NAD(P)-dependent dehydrogenase (short-subunit alcohol dehydrogenase family)